MGMRSLLSSETPGAAQGTQGSGRRGGQAACPHCVLASLVRWCRFTRTHGSVGRRGETAGLKEGGGGRHRCSAPQKAGAGGKGAEGGPPHRGLGSLGESLGAPSARLDLRGSGGVLLQAQEPLTEMTLPSGHLKRGLGTGTRTNVATWGPFSTPPPVPHKHLCKRNETSR